MLRYLKWALIICIVLPIAGQAVRAYGAGWPASWHSADWSSTQTLPAARDDGAAMVRIYAARSGRWKSIFAVHHWIILKPAGGEYSRYEVVGWGRPVRLNNYPPDGRWYSNEPFVVHEVRGRKAGELIPQIIDAVADYEWQTHGSYSVWPGPNSNTFVAHVLRQVPQLAAEMDPAGIGKDYLGPGFTIAPTPSGTGWQVSLWGLAGAAIARKEGVELHFLGATIGFEFDSLAIKLPGIGRISVWS